MGVTLTTATDPQSPSESSGEHQTAKPKASPPKPTNNHLLDEILEEVFRAGVGSQADDIKGNDKAYLNLQKHYVAKAKQQILDYIRQVIGEDEEESYEYGGIQSTFKQNHKVFRNQLRAEQRKVLGGSDE